MNRKYTDEQLEEIAEDAREAYSISAVARKWGCNKSTVERAIRKAAEAQANREALHSGPYGAQCSYQGGYYKVGLRGMVFMHNGSEWVRSTLSRSELRA